MYMNFVKIKGWLRLQFSKPHRPYSLCQRPVEALPVFQALRARAEQQALHQALGLKLTAQGVVVPAPPAGEKPA
jgi:hypothetical protein